MSNRSEAGKMTAYEKHLGAWYVRVEEFLKSLFGVLKR